MGKRQTLRTYSSWLSIWPRSSRQPRRRHFCRRGLSRSSGSRLRQVPDRTMPRGRLDPSPCPSWSCVATSLPTRQVACLDSSSTREPKPRRHLGKSNLAADVVTKDLVWDATRGGDLELELPLPWWQQLLTRFRPFDVNYSPCRH